MQLLSFRGEMRILLIVFLLCATLNVSGQSRYRIMMWNVENLFDCNDDTLKQDEEFLPGSERQWTWGRYWRKVEDVSRVIMGVGDDMPPALVGLAEVENDSVMISLTKMGALRTLGYDYVMTDSPDQRGVDVALMYLPQMFRLMGNESVRIPSTDYGLRPTRDLLHAWGRVQNGDTLHIVVCHLPSRAGDSKDNRKNRELAIGTLVSLIDSLLVHIPQCRLLVMGDFNATLRDKSLKPLRRIKSINALTPDDRRPTKGTYKYKGNWGWIDHIFVSESLYTGNDCHVQLYVQPWMKRMVNDDSWYPRRTYLGTHYAGGVSDHLPIFSDFYW